MKTIHKNITVTGRVQGVFFRATAMDRALTLGINGYVKNLTNGSVYIEAEGSLKNVESLIEWCKEGPTFSKVEGVKVNDGEVTGFKDFSIHR